MDETVKVALVQYAARHSHMAESKFLAEKALAQLEADAQARADVRTLDDAATTETYWKTVPAKGGRWRCTRMVWRGDEYGEDWLPAEELDGPTPDAARHAAAEWVRSQR